jgi:propionate CoA-transferase
MVRDVVARFYNRVTRYTTSAFTRAQIGDALKTRQLAPHIFDNHGEALAKLRE